MANEEKIKNVIKDIATRRKNVTFAEIQWVFDQLAPHFPGEHASRSARHWTLYRLGGQRFMVSNHNPGSCHVKSYAVDDFLNAMAELGWYEE